MRPLYLFHLLVLSTALLYAQSIDEEESVHLGAGGTGSLREGSADTVFSDDEDFEGSALPPDTQYATKPQVHPKSTTTVSAAAGERGRGMTNARGNERTTTRPITTVVKQKVSQLAQTTSPPEEEQEEDPQQSNVPFSSSNILWTHGIVIILAAILLILFTLIMIIICCKAYHKRKQAYRPGQRLSPDALLKE